MEWVEAGAFGEGDSDGVEVRFERVVVVKFDDVVAFEAGAIAVRSEIGGFICGISVRRSWRAWLS